MFVPPPLTTGIKAGYVACIMTVSCPPTNELEIPLQVVL
jgi:hypothetical protein